LMHVRSATGRNNSVVNGWPVLNHRRCRGIADAFEARSNASFSCPLSCVPVSILCGDPEFPASKHTGASPPGSLAFPAYEHFGFHALHVILVGERVFAGCRENRVPPGRLAASDPRVFAVSETRFAAIVATAGLTLELRKFPHDRTPRILAVRRSTRRPAPRCPVNSSGACRPFRLCRPRPLLWRFDGDAGKRAGACGLRHRRAGEAKEQRS
jgi:hypothetical protein